MIKCDSSSPSLGGEVQVYTFKCRNKYAQKRIVISSLKMLGTLNIGL